MNDIAVIGMSGKFPNNLNTISLWRLLIKGGNTFTKLSKDDLVDTEHDRYYDQGKYIFSCSRLTRQDLFDAKTFQYNPTEALLMDPQHRIFLTCCKEALEYAALPDPELKGFKTGVYAGCSVSSYFIFNVLKSKYAQYNPMQLLMATDKDFISTRVAYKLNLRGPAITVQTGCSTSLVAIHQAYQALVNREIDMALAGGASVNALGRVGYFYTPEGALSSDGICRPFDEKADGTVFSDAVAVVALCRLDDAIKHNLNIFAVIKASAINNNGNDCAGFAAPSVNGQADVINRCLTLSTIEFNEIAAIETHGTGTKLGDSIEINALKKVFPISDRKYCAIGSIKANIGHCDTASGVVGVIKAVLSIQNKMLPAQVNVDVVNPYLQIEDSPFFIPQTNICLNDKKIINIGVSSFGFGGTNAHLILSSYKKNSISTSMKNLASEHYLLLFSAPNKELLDKYIAETLKEFKTLQNDQLGNVQYTLLNGRTDFTSRAFITCSDIQNIDESAFKYSSESLKQVRPVFIFPGQGTTWDYAGQLYKSNSFFRKEVEKFIELFKKESGEDFLSIILSSDTAHHMEKTSIVQPVLFILGTALGRLLESMGVAAQEVMGHSLGEISAACFAGAISDEDAVRLVSARAELMENRTDEGVMIVIFCGEADIRNILKDEVFDIAAYNSDNQFVISTIPQRGTIITGLLQKQNIRHKVLSVRKGFHSCLMDPIMEEWREIAAKVAHSSPKFPIMSTFLAKYIRGAKAFKGAEHWVGHLREPVRFHQSVSEICKSHEEKGTVPLFIEIGGGTNLSILAQAQEPEVPFVSISSTSNQIDEKSLYKFLGDLWLSGYPFHKKSIASCGHVIPLPISGLDETSFWIRPDTNAGPSLKESNCHPVHKNEEKDAVEGNVDTKSDVSLENIVKRIVGEAFKLPVTSINDDFDFFASSGQSMLATTIVLNLRRELKLKIPLDYIYNFPVISDLIREVLKIKQNHS